MFELATFVRECEAAISRSMDVDAIADAVREAVADPIALLDALPPITGDEALLFSSEQLVVVHIRMTPNVHYPPHNHNMSAIVGTYIGSERSHAYKLSNKTLSEVGYHDSTPGDVVVLSPDAIHSVANIGNDFSQGLHVYAGDLIHQERNIWDPETFEVHPYSDECYFNLSRAYNTERPFAQPSVCYAHERSK